MTLLVDLAGVPAHAAIAPRFLAQTAAPAPAPAPLPADAPQPSPWSGLIMPLMMIAVFMFIFAPQMKRNKEHKKLISSLEPGAEVLTSGGLFGVVTAVKPDRFVIEIAKGVRIEVNRNNVEARIPNPGATEADKEKKL